MEWLGTYTSRENVEAALRKRNASLVELRIAARELRLEKQREGPSNTKLGAIIRRDLLLRREQEAKAAFERCDEAFEASVLTYAKSEVNALALTIVVKLPRELRDVVYSNLLDRVAKYNYRLDLNQLNRPMKMWKFDQQILPWTPMVGKKLFWEDREFVGPIFAKELVEMYFQTCTFQLNPRNIALLDTFLGPNAYSEGLMVVENIRHLDLMLPFEEPGLRYTYWPIFLRGRHIHHEHAKALICLRAGSFRQEYHPLIRISRCCNIKFLFSVWDGALGVFAFQQVAKKLLPLVAVLQSKEHRVTIEVKRVEMLTGRINFSEESFSNGLWVLKESSSRNQGHFLKVAYQRYEHFDVENPDEQMVRRFLAEFEDKELSVVSW